VKNAMTCVMGIDIGSAYSKGIILRDGKTLEAYDCPSRGDYKLTAERVRGELLAGAGLTPADIVYTVATGYGSKTAAFAEEVRPDIACHSKGIHHLFPSVRTAVDVGDLYSKVFRIDMNGNLASFILSGKCAGGSGRVLQVIARVLQLKVEDIGDLSLKSKNRIDFNTGCVVFAESEAISRVAEGVAKEDLLAGIHRALAAQVDGLAERIGIERDMALVGGGARDVGLVKALEEIKGFNIIVPPDPHMTAALGAALMAGEKNGN
jgi:predicted CoA-substrate-specific enzyme activase